MISAGVDGFFDRASPPTVSSSSGHTVKTHMCSSGRCVYHLQPSGGHVM